MCNVPLTMHQSLSFPLAYSIMYSAMIKTQIYLREDQLLGLKDQAIRSNQPYAQLVRVAVDEYLQKNQVKAGQKKFSWREFAEKHATNLGGLGSRIDEELYGW